MEQPKQTPETWRAQPTAGHEKHGQSVVYSEQTGRDVAIVYDGKAHANMIAAAPELLRTSKALADEAFRNMTGGRQDLIDDVYAAIYKAERGDQ